MLRTIRNESLFANLMNHGTRPDHDIIDSDVLFLPKFGQVQNAVQFITTTSNERLFRVWNCSSERRTKDPITGFPLPFQCQKFTYHDEPWTRQLWGHATFRRSAEMFAYNSYPILLDFLIDPNQRVRNWHFPSWWTYSTTAKWTSFDPRWVRCYDIPDDEKPYFPTLGWWKDNLRW